jgi:hypothetical protein
MAQLAALRKSFAAHLKTKSARTSESGGSGPNEQLLEQFSRVSSILGWPLVQQFCWLTKKAGSLIRPSHKRILGFNE